MKKILIIIIFLLLINTVNSQENSLSDVNEELNKQTEQIYGEYGILIKVDIVDSSANPQADAIKSFVSKYKLDKKGNKFWNVLIFYSREQNDLRLVSFRRCSLGKDTLKAIKGSSLVKAVLDKESPSEEEVNNMLSYVIGEIRHVIYDVKPRKDMCLTGDYADILRDYEYVVSEEVIKIFLDITQVKRTDKGVPSAGVPSASYILNPPANLKSKSLFEKKLYDLGYNEKEVDEYWEELVTKGNIIINKEEINEFRFKNTLMHERFHKEWLETLSKDELSTLYEPYYDMVKTNKRYEGFSLFDYGWYVREEEKPSALGDDGHRLAVQIQISKYYEEFYAHLATGYLIEPIEETIRKYYPDAYIIFNELRERVKFY